MTSTLFRRRDLLAGLGFCLGYLVLDWLSRGLELWSGVTTWYPAAGLGLGFLLVFGTRFGAFIAVAAGLAAVMSAEHSLLGLLVLPALKGLVYTGGAWLLQRAGFDRLRFNGRDAALLVAAALLVPLPIAAFVVTDGFVAGAIPADSVVLAVVHFFLGDAVGVLTIAPLMLAFAPELRAERQPALPTAAVTLRFVAYGAITLGLALLVFAFGFGERLGQYLVFLPVLHIAVRHRLRDEALAVATVSFAAAWAVARMGVAPAAVAELQAFLLALAATGLFAAAAVRAGRHLRRQREHSDDERERNAALLAMANIVPWEADAENNCFTFVGAQAESVFAYPMSQWLEKGFWEDRIHPDDRERVVSFCRDHAWDGEVYQLDYRMRGVDEGYRHVYDVVSAKLGPDQRLRLYGFLTDVTAFKALEDRVSALKFHDRDTGLPNRRLLLDWLQRSLVDGYACTALAAANIDRFHAINDAFGNAIGDALLERIGARLNGRIDEDTMVARLGANEFGLALRAPADNFDPEDAQVLALASARILRRVLDEVFIVEGLEIVLQASIGYASAAADDSAEVLLRDVETARQEARLQGGGRSVPFDESQRRSRLDLAQLETELAAAARDPDQWKLLYQPIIDLCAGRLEGFEVLIRWKHPSRGLLTPAEFFPSAERLSLIDSLDRMVMRDALTAFVPWHREDPTLKLSLNMHGSHFADPSLVERTQSALSAARLPATSLNIEITESVLLGADEVTQRNLKSLRELGIGLHVDDFGTGYASLIYINRFPVSHVKIDRSFIAGIEFRKNFEIVRAIVELAARLSLGVTAEGVETLSQCKVLKELGCPLAQGYLFSTPLDQAQAGRWASGDISIPFGAGPGEAEPLELAESPAVHRQS